MSAPDQASAPSKSPRSYTFEELAVGMSASRTREITEQVIADFARVCGDHNPIHVDPAYAAASIFKERVAHGMLSAGIMSGLFGEDLPGPGAIYVNQSLKFRAPVKIGDHLVARAEVTSKIPAKNLVVFKTECRVGDKVVVEGEATLFVPSAQKT